MRKTGGIFLMAIALAFASVGTAGAAACPGSTKTGPPQKVLITFRGGADAAALTRAGALAGPLRIRRTYRHLPVVAATLTADQIGALAHDPSVVRVVPDRIVKLPPITTQSKPVPPTLHAPVTVRQADPGIAPAQTQLGLDGDTANDGVRHYSNNDQVIAIVDTGVDGTQPDLARGKILTFEDFVTDPAPDCAPPPDPIVSWDPVGHGTLVASVAAGAGITNSKMIGVAPGAALVVLKVFDCKASSPTSTIAAALDWLLSNHATYGVDVVNMSFGSSASFLDGSDLLSQLANQLAAAGVVPVAAAGNQGPGFGTIDAPGVAQWALTAGAERANTAGNNVAEFSGRGLTGDGRIKPDVLTPGVDILGVQANTPSPKYSFNSGTSLAAPYLSGMAALALQADPSLKPSGTACACADGVDDASMTAPLTDLARASATDWNVAGPDAETGWGVLHAWPFLAAATQSGNAGPKYPQHFVREGAVADNGASVLPITVRAGKTVTVGLTVPSVNTFNGPFVGLYALDAQGAPIAVHDDCYSAGNDQQISSTCYPFGSASRAVGMAWTPTDSGTAFIGIRSFAGATTHVLDIDGARAVANTGIPVTVAVSGTPIAPGGRGGTVTVSLDRQPAKKVHVELLNDGGLALSATALTFTPRNWNHPQTVTATAVPQAARMGNPHGSTLVAIATGTTLDDSGIATPQSVPVLDDPSLPDGPRTERVSLTDAGTESWGSGVDILGSLPFVSADGSAIAFTSRAIDLAGTDPNGHRPDVFVRDRKTGHTERITPETALNTSTLEGMSDDGRLILFSVFDAVTPGDTNSDFDLYVKNRTTGTVRRVNRTSTQAEMPRRACRTPGPNGFCLELPGAISGNGQHVAFVTDVPMTPDAPTNGPEVYARNLATGAVTRVSVASNGSNGVPNTVQTGNMTTAISNDGSVVLFSSASDGLAPGALPGQMNVYAHNLTTGATTLVNADVSGNGLPAQFGPVLLSGNGKYAAFVTYDGLIRLYVKNIATGEIEQANLTTDGSPSTDYATPTSISADGRTVAFVTRDAAVGGGGMVMRNLDTGVITQIVTWDLDDFFVSYSARISSSAQYAVWDSNDAHVVTGDTNMTTDTFWRKLH